MLVMSEWSLESKAKVFNFIQQAINLCQEYVRKETKKVMRE